jgi:hypothetical protein
MNASLRGAPMATHKGHFILNYLASAGGFAFSSGSVRQVRQAATRWAFALLVCPLAAGAADRIATVTLLEGPAALMRGVTRYALVEGVRLQPGDIIENGDKGVTEIEFSDGAALALGPSTRMLTVSASRGKSAAGDYYVMQGALKLSGVKQAASVRFVTPVFTLETAEGTTVLVVDKGEGSVFVESGEARLIEPAAKGAASGPLRLKNGEFYTRKAEQRGTVAPRPSQAFIGALPRIFLDPLPSRMARYKERETQPRRGEEVSYADVEAWLKAPPDIRRPLIPRFRPRIHDPAFRSGLVANLKFHMEWDPILFPEKYKPKEPAAPAKPAGKR